MKKLQRAMLPPRRLLILVLLLLATFAAVANFYLSGKWVPESAKTVFPPTNHHQNCPKGLEYLTNLNITFPVNYARRDIVVNPIANRSRDSVTKVDELLFPQPQLIDLMENHDMGLRKCLAPLLLDVPAYSKEPVDASHIIFGMATLLDRLELSIVDLERWLAYTKAHLIIIAMGPDETDPDSKQMARMQTKMRALGLQVTIVNRLGNEDNMAERYFSLVKIMYEQRAPGTKWIGVIDDDTFFPSMHSLVESLDRYDPEERLYIGAMSEEWWAVVHYGIMGFGGAGIFLSLPLAAALNAHYDECKKRSRAGAGDMRILECIIWHTDTKLTHVPGLHQIDMHGDLSGLYESGRLPLSLHHWKQGWWDEKGYGTWFPMAAMHAVAEVCGDCFLQRWQFQGDVVITNGYSIAEYPTGAWKKADDEGLLERMEFTWLEAGVVEGSNNAGWDHYLGPFRPMLELEKEKIQYRFLHAVAVDGGVRQFYIHLGLNGDFDTLLELFWVEKEHSTNEIADHSLG